MIFQSFIEETLLDNEQVVYRAKVSPFIYAWPILVLAIAVGMYLTSPGIGLLALAIDAILFIKSFLAAKTTEVAVTNQRVIVKVGFISRDSIDLPIGRVESVSVYQTIMGRLLNYGGISVSGVGGTIEPVLMIDNPMGFRRAVLNQRQSAWIDSMSFSDG